MVEAGLKPNRIHFCKLGSALLGICLCLVIAFGCGQDNRTEQTKPSPSNQDIIDPAPLQSSAQTATPPAATLRKVRLKIDVSGFENNEGNCRIAVYLNQPHFNDVEYAIAKESVRIAELKAEWQMDLEIPFSSGSDSTTSNRLAVSAFHDANTNSRLDKNSFGIPTERYGFSKNPKRGFGPPKFIETALELDLPDSPNDSNVVVEVPIQIK